MPSVITWDEKHSSKQVALISYSEKTFLAVSTFESFVSVFFFDRVKKLIVNFGLYKSSQHF